MRPSRRMASALAPDSSMQTAMAYATWAADKHSPCSAATWAVAGLANAKRADEGGDLLHPQSFGWIETRCSSRFIFFNELKRPVSIDPFPFKARCFPAIDVLLRVIMNLWLNVFWWLTTIDILSGSCKPT